MSSLGHFALPVLLLCGFAQPVSSIMVPETHPGNYRELEQSGRRGLVVESVASREKELEEFLHGIPCIASFLETHLKRPAWTSLIIVDDEEKVYDVARALDTSLRTRFAFFRSAVHSEPEISQRASNAIILMSNASSLEDNHYVLAPCDVGCPFLAILITPFDSEEIFLEEADAVARSMWTRKISTFIILARVGESVFAAGSLTYESDKPCAPSPPVILDKCEADESWSELKKIKAPKMNGCILKIAYFEEPPYVIAVNTSERLSGFEGRLTEEIMEGQIMDRERVDWIENTSYAEQVQILLRNDAPADLVVGRVLQQPEKSIGYSTTYDMVKVVWVIPKVPNVSLKGLVQPFEPYVWAAIGGSLLLAGLVKLFLNHDLSWLNIFALIIGVSIARQPSRLSGKIQFISWTIFGLFLTQVYVDSLADQLINLSDVKIETMNVLISSSFRIGGTSVFARLFDQFEQNDELVPLIRQEFVVFDQEDYLKQFDDLLSGTNSSFALVAVLNSSRNDAIETAYAYTMTTDVICSFPLGLASRKGFPYLRHIDDKIHDYIDLGIFDYMIELAIGKERRARLFQAAQNEEYKAKLHFQQFVPAFLLMVIGFSTGLALFVLEIVLYPSKLLK